MDSLICKICLGSVSVSIKENKFICITMYTYIADIMETPCQQFCNHDLISIVSDDSVLMVVLSQEEQRPPVLEERMPPPAFLVIYRIVTEGISVLY